ncbi:DUF624 domain-containing protein [Enterococcus phoeniculicola]|jgi:uncharacterized membrane protein YesL|uniref:DUF624 domain-containing protein n=1 Tax=Enterococcus phoeniculicola ATCC BAA-412 TaxID=1158610 RepID=R3WII9_9ENTE|nr:DUF624 domain-containing protein [Enterococcus phoeniculicola]EOL41715.1 hypothetical protein UC3_03280 [Enterococcus phoeniculicola ATCC BAA-412]EOT78791.1 hypothetical protein I589_00296 [Enterococcus phoeniculicola ATCC BAA-412]
MNSKNIYQLVSVVSDTFLLNLNFLLANLPLWFVMLLLPFSLEAIFFYYLALIFTGPSLVAILFVAGKWIREKSYFPIKDFWRSYRQNFWLSFFQWWLYLTIFTILFIDLFYMIERQNLLLFGIISLLFFFCVMMYLVGNVVLGRFEVGGKTLVKMGLYCCFHSFKELFFAISAMVGFIALSYIQPGIAFLMGFSIVAYAMMYYLTPMLIRLEKEFTS